MLTRLGLALALAALVYLVGATPPVLAQQPEAGQWTDALKAAPGRCPIGGFPGTVYVPSRTVDLFSGLPLSSADWNLNPFSGSCYTGPPQQYRIVLGDPNGGRAVLRAIAGRQAYEEGTADPSGSCRQSAAGYCTTRDPYNFTEHFYLSVKGHEAVVRHNVSCSTTTPTSGLLDSCSDRSDFWALFWYDPAEDLSYAVELWDAMARRLGAPLTFEVSDHRPYAQRLADTASGFLAVSLR